MKQPNDVLSFPAFTQINKATEISLLYLLDQCVQPHIILLWWRMVGGRKAIGRSTTEID